MCWQYFLFLGWLVFFPWMVSAQTAEILQLELNQPLERGIAEKETHFYKINVKKGDFVRLTVQQKNADVSAAVYSPDGAKLFEINNSNSTEELEKISLLAENDGELRVEIKLAANLPRINGLGYVIKLESLRPATAQDKNLVAAEQLYNRAGKLRFESKEESKRAAIELFQQSIPLFAAAGDKNGEAFAYYSIGQLYSTLDLSKSLENSEKATQIFRQINARPQSAMSLLLQATIYFYQNKTAESLKYLDEIQKIYQEIGDKRGEAEIIGNLGAIYAQQNQPRKALEFFLKSLPFLQTVGDQAGEARTLSNIGSIYDDLGEPVTALEYYEKALKIRRERGDKRGIAFTLVNMSIVLKTLGEIQKFLEANAEAMEYFRTSGEKENEASCLSNLGVGYFALGDWEKALNFHEKSLAINREKNAKTNQAFNLVNIADIRALNGQIDQALVLYAQAQTLFQEEKDKRNIARTMVKTGVAYQKKGDNAKALGLFQQALPILQEVEDREWQAQTLFHTAESLRQNGDLTKAYQIAREALEMQRAVKDALGEINALFSVAQIEKALGRWTEAQKSIETALNGIENYRGKISRQDLRASYFADKQNSYGFYLDLLMQRHKAEPTLGFDILALQTAERTRARNLLDSLTNIRPQIRSGVKPELSSKANYLQQTIRAKEVLRTQLILQKAAPEKIAEAEKELESLLREQDEIEAKIRETSPDFAALTQPQLFDLAQFQKEVLDNDTVLLEYALGAERSFLFLATKTKLEVFELPKQAEIEVEARKFLENLNARVQTKPDETLSQRQTRLQKSDKMLQDSSTKLNRILLAPVAEKISNKRLLIVSSGILQYIPLAALKDKNYLLETNEIINLPSASVLQALRKVKRETVTNTIAVFADPVFSADDIRLKNPTKTGTSQTQNWPPEMRNGLARLRFSRLEAEAISALISNNKKFVALDFAANSRNVQSPNLSRTRFIHFATHGFVNSEMPEFSGLVLSLVNEKGEPQDGFLRLHEIYNLRLNADLVVLSACQTALGRDIKGEGVVGLTRGFMYAGASSVVASLWNVDDRATAKLMKVFYQKMLQDNLRPAAALRAAQITLLREKETESPYYWAAFTIMGEFR